MIRLGLSSDNDAMGRIINFGAISKSGDLGDALKVFDRMPHPDAFIYNTLISGYLLAQRLLAIPVTQKLHSPVFPNVRRICYT